MERKEQLMHCTAGSDICFKQTFLCEMTPDSHQTVICCFVLVQLPCAARGSSFKVMYCKLYVQTKLLVKPFATFIKDGSAGAK